MSNTRTYEPNPRAEELLGRYLTGELDADGAGELARLLKNDERFGDWAYENLQTEILLRHLADHQNVIDLLLEIDELNPALAVSAAWNGPKASAYEPARRNSSELGILPWIMTVSLVLIAIAAWSEFFSPSSKPVKSPEAAQNVHSPEPIIRSETARRAAVVLADSFEAVWDAPVAPQPGETFFATSYRLRSGFAKLQFHSGAVVLLEAGTEIRLTESDRMSCEAGTLATFVPKSAAGFRVDLPQVSVIDLGTIFTVHVAGDRSEVQTLSGEVLAIKQSGDAANGTDKILVAGGSGVRFFPDGSVWRYRANLSTEPAIRELAETPAETGRETFEAYRRAREDRHRVPLPDWPVVALRGCAQETPENTLDAFRQAVQAGADACELNVVLSLDGEAFIQYPDRVDAAKSHRDAYKKIPSTEIRDKKLTLPGQAQNPAARTWPIPSLEETLAFFQTNACPIVLDFYDLDSVPVAMELVEKYGLRDRTIAVSRFSEVVAALKQRDASLCVGLLVRGNARSTAEVNAQRFIAEADACGADFVRVENSFVTPQLIRLLKNRGLGIWSWNFPRKKSVEEFIRNGGDAVMTYRLSDISPIRELFQSPINTPAPL